MCEQHFKTHKATLIQDTDRYLIIDWRREDGSGAYYVNYIVDKIRGSLIVSGDLGDSIATWFNHLEPSKLKKYIHNDVGYYIDKLQCASDTYTYAADDFVADIKTYIDDYDVDEYIDLNNDFDSKEAFWDYIAEEAENSMYGIEFRPTEALTEVISRINADYWEWLSACGKRQYRQ